jgi:hypothetical protein
MEVLYFLVGLVALMLLAFLVLYATNAEARSGINWFIVQALLFICSLAFIVSLCYYLGKFIFPAILNLAGVKFPL